MPAWKDVFWVWSSLFYSCPQLFSFTSCMNNCCLWSWYKLRIYDPVWPFVFTTVPKVVLIVLTYDSVWPFVFKTVPKVFVNVLIYDPILPFFPLSSRSFYRSVLTDL